MSQLSFFPRSEAPTRRRNEGRCPSWLAGTPGSWRDHRPAGVGILVTTRVILDHDVTQEIQPSGWQDAPRCVG